MPAGRKSKYDQDTFPNLAEQFAREGLSDEQIAKNLGIGTRTYYEYLEKYPQFSQAIKRGKKPVDIEIENALFKRAKGYTVEEVHTEYINDGSENPKIKTQKRVKKEIAPDTGAIVFWLTNRVPHRWQNKQNTNVNVTNKREEIAALFPTLDEFKKHAKGEIDK